MVSDYTYETRLAAEQMENLIYVIRGQKVMLDVDLAKIYGYETKSFNQQVKRSIEKFDNDFMFRLTREETEKCSRSQNVTLNEGGNSRGYNTKYLPYAFTEQGIYMLMTVLKGELATKQMVQYRHKHLTILDQFFSVTRLSKLSFFHLKISKIIFF